MIRYSLKCDKGHTFDSWFKSSDAFDVLDAQGMINCAVCGSASVSKAIMAPRVATAEDRSDLTAPATEAERAVAALRDKVESEADYVGDRFAKDVRAMHAGEVPERAIYGEASLPEAKSMIEDGLQIAPLPFVPKTKSN
jgi:hypothetical protein